MESLPTLYRNRLIPTESICLSDDIIIHLSEDVIVTKWNTLKPRDDIERGLSAYFLNDGYKVSKIYDANDKLVYWYCDIIETKYDIDTDSYYFNDLLIDILIYEDGRVEIVDLDEMADLMEEGSVSQETCAKALRTTNKLLSLIYKGDFHMLQQTIEDLE